MLDDQIKFYRRKKEKFFKLYAGKYIVIKNFTVIGAYDSHTEAYSETVKSHQVGTFIIKAIIERDNID